MKKKMIFIIAIALLVILLIPRSASDAISNSLSKETISVKSFLITYPGVDGDIIEYEISDDDLKKLFEDLNNMKIIRFPISKLMRQNTTKRKISIDLIENEVRTIYIRIFNNQITVNDKSYLILNPEEEYFKDLVSELKALEK